MTVVASVDGVELGPGHGDGHDRGGGSRRRVSAGRGRARATVEDFPSGGGARGRGVAAEAQSELCHCQAARLPPGENRVGTVGGGRCWRIPPRNSFQSGVGVISGWVCEADTVEIELGHLGRQDAAYGTERLDTLGGVWGHGQRLWVIVQTGTGWATASMKSSPSWTTRSLRAGPRSG